MSSLRKLFAVGSTVALLAVGFLGTSSSALAAAHGAGSLVKSSDGTVWFIDNNGVRSAFTSAGALQSYGFLSFSQVVDANSDDLALPTGPFIAPRDGSIFCATATKGSDVAGECSLITGGMKAAFTSASVFGGLGFSFSRAHYGDSSFMSKTTNIGNTSDAHRPGVLVNNHGTVQLVGTSSLLGIPSIDVFNSWGYSFSDVVPANGADQGINQSGVMVARTPGQLNPSFTSTPQNGQMSVALAGDNPASGTVVMTQAAADLAHFSFTGSGTVTSISLKRIGVSADTSLQNVYLFDGSTRITDAASVSAGSVINFNNASGLFTVNGSKTISVRSDLNAASGETLGVQLTGVTLMGGGAVTGAPVSGNLMSVASATTASVSLSTPSVLVPGGSIDAGKDITVWSSNATVSTRDVNLTRFALREIGSVNYSDINNFRLYVDGTQVATQASLDANGYVTFSLNSPVKLMTGTRVLKVVADIIGGSSRSATFSLRNKADIGLVDTQYNVGVAISSAVPSAAGTFNINSGSIVVQKTNDSPSANVTTNGSDVTLGKWTFTAYGESVKVDTLLVDMTYNGAPGATNNAAAKLRNGRLLVNGAQVGSTTTLDPAGTGTSYTVNTTVVPGSPVTVEYRADVFDNDGTGVIDAGDTIKVTLSQGSQNGQGVVSGTTSNVPTGNTDANTVTVASGTISLARTTNYANQTTVVPQTAYKLADMQLTGNSTEDVNINTITVNFTNVTGGAADFTAADLSNVYITYNGVRESNTKASVTNTGNTWSVSHVLAKNTTANIQIFADIGSTITANEGLKTTSIVVGTTAQSGTTVGTDTNGDGTGTGTDGQTITYNTAAITSAVDASTPASKLVDDNSTNTVAAYKFTTTGDTFTIIDVTVKANAGSMTSATTFALKDSNGTVIQTKPAATSVTFAGVNIPVMPNSTKTLSVDVSTGVIGTGAGTANENIGLTLDTFKYATSTGTTTSDGTDRVGNNMYAYHSVPTITNVPLPTSLLANGTQTLAKVTVSSNGTGTVSWAQLTFNVAMTTHPSLANFAVYDADTNTAIAGTKTNGNGGADISGGTPLAGVFAAGQAGGLVTFTPTAEQEVSGAKTYLLKATVGGANVAGDSITTSILNPSSHAASNQATTVEGTNASFVWSDESASPHSLTSTDWNNDYLVKSLPTDGQTLAK